MLNVEAKSVYCKYEGENDNIIVEYTVDSNYNIHPFLNNNGNLNLIYGSDNIVLGDFNKNSNGEFEYYCKDVIYYKKSLKGTKVGYDFSFTKLDGYDSKANKIAEKIDNNTSSSKEIVRTCPYSNLYVIYYYNDNTLKVDGINGYRNKNIKITSSVNAEEIKELFSTHCPDTYPYDNKVYYDISANDIIITFAPVKGLDHSVIHGDSEDKTDNQNSENEIGCRYLFGDPEKKEYIAYWLQWGLNAIKYFSIVALLVLSTMDFIKALVANDKDALQKATKKVALRFLFTVIVFFIPIIVEVVMKLFGAYGTCGIK